MTAIATYLAKWPDGRFRLELTADDLRVAGFSALGSRRVETAVPLASLQPRVERIWTRSALFSIALWFAVLGFVAHRLSSLAPDRATSESVSLLGLVFGVLGLVGCAVFFRRTEFARFVTVAGVPAVDVARTGDRAAFDEFVAKVLAGVAGAHERGASSRSA